MSVFVRTLKASLDIFLAHPKLIVPKLAIAFLYSISIISISDLLGEALAEPSLSLLAKTLVLLGFILLIGFVDIVASAMYPFMVADVRAKKPVSLSSALGSVLKNSRKVLLPPIVVEAAFLMLLFALSIPLSFLVASDSSYSVLFTALYIAVVLALVFLFYSIYPVAAYERVSLADSLKRSVKISLGNKAEVAKATLLSFALSLVSFGIALSIELLPPQEGTALFWAAFVIIRFLTAYVYAYLYVLNPVFYLEYMKAK